MKRITIADFQKLVNERRSSWGTFQPIGDDVLILEIFDCDIYKSPLKFTDERLIDRNTPTQHEDAKHGFMRDQELLQVANSKFELGSEVECNDSFIGMICLAYSENGGLHDSVCYKVCRTSRGFLEIRYVAEDEIVRVISKLGW